MHIGCAKSTKNAIFNFSANNDVGAVDSVLIKKLNINK